MASGLKAPGDGHLKIETPAALVLAGTAFSAKKKAKKKFGKGLLPIVIWACLAGLICQTCILSSVNRRTLVGKKFYMKTNLVFLEDPPRVYPSWIYFMKDPADCNAWPLPIPHGTYLYMYEGIEIVGFKDLGAFMSVRVKPATRPKTDGSGRPVDQAPKEVYLKKNWAGGFSKTFNKVFSAEPVAELPYVKLKTATDLIKYCGYPIYRCQRNSLTIFHYNEWYTTHSLIGGHTAWFEIKDGKIVGWGGEI